MPLTVHFEDGFPTRAPLVFEDNVDRIKIGRDATLCQVVFPDDLDMVGREHCSIVRQGKDAYDVCPTSTHLLYINGDRIADCLPFRFENSVELQLGDGGPKLVADIGRTEKGRRTKGIVHLPGERELIEREKARRRQLTLGASCFAVLLSLFVAVVASRFNSRIAVIERETIDLAALSQQEFALLRTIQSASGRVDPETKAQFEKQLQRAKRSVYLVVHVSGHRHVEPIATAWVVDRDGGRLATNAHVARSVYPPRDGDHFEVRRLAADGLLESHVIQSTVVHPGYDAFAQLWKDYEPSAPTEAGTPEHIDFATQACDVALLVVSRDEPLADNLLPAEQDTLEGLEATTTIASLGFPLEGIGQGVVNANSPTPVVQVAHLTAVTDYFGREIAPAPERLLVQHAAPATRGSSGSPILNKEGRVIAVHSSGIPIGKTDQGNVVCTPANVFFAHRVDLVRELLASDLGKLQARRAASWDATIRLCFAQRKDINNQLAIDDLRDDACKTGAAQGEFDVQVASTFPIVFDSAVASVRPDVDSSNETRWRVPGPGRYVLFALDPTRHACQISAELFQDHVSVGKLPGLSFDGHPWLSYLTFDAVAKLDEAMIRVQSPSPGANVVVQALQMSRVRRSADKLREQLVAPWLASSACSSAGYKMAQVVQDVVEEQALQTDSQGQTGCGYRLRIKLDEPSCYLLTAVTKNGSPLGISLSDRSAESAATPDSSAKPTIRSWLSCPIEAKEPRELTATILGVDPDECEAVLYRAVR